ncbi:MAG: aminomethyl-transferring glycine dehydrogenase subunit GcvPA [Magnetococcales bacterium]|nr:aminomethyl-transferring glycine dehydrogenase subunit GcvPA [Magnetococcales bacterium]
MPYIPHTDADVAEMLAVIGVNTTQDLFDEIPAELKVDSENMIPEGAPEWRVAADLRQRAASDRTLTNFIGAGAYDHHIPAAVWELVTRGEFYTAYTPYQAEASQGTLQTLYEFQTMIAGLMAMDLSNASLYDGASALAEAVLMAIRANRKVKSKVVLMPESLHPVWRQVVHTLVRHQGIILKTVRIDSKYGVVQPSALAEFDSEEIAALVIPQPNLFGQLEDVDTLTDWAKARGALSIAAVNPMAMALLKPPGQWGSDGVDIACGEGQPLGIPLSSGGPYFGFLTAKKALVRQVPGRIVGRTVDGQGREGFVLTLQAREQHIRRSRATSNICTNQGLMTTAATLYMTLLGPQGLHETAISCHANAQHLRDAVEVVPGVSIRYTGPFFHEFIITLDGINSQDDKAVPNLMQRMAKKGYAAGLPLSLWYPERRREILLCATEIHDAILIDAFAETLREELACL